MNFTLKQDLLRREHLDDFVTCFAPGRSRDDRVESERFRSFDYGELVARGKANLGSTWLKDASLEDLDNLPPPEVIAREIVEDLTAAVGEFEAVAAALEATSNKEGRELSCTRGLWAERRYRTGTRATARPTWTPNGLGWRNNPNVRGRAGE
jgi:hypothetical protein